MTRARAVMLFAALAAGLAFGCVERQADLDTDEDLRAPACMLVLGRGYWDDGTTATLLTEDMGSSSVCMCMTWDEFVDQVHVDELNERALVECNRMAALEDFDWNDCQSSYEQGTWLPNIYFDLDDRDWFNREGLTCGDEAAPNCSVHERQTPELIGALVLVLLLALRQRPVRDDRGGHA